MADGPMSTPRRLAPMSSGTPRTRMRRVGNDCVPLGGKEVTTRGISGLLAMQGALPNLSPCHDTLRPPRHAPKRYIPFLKCYDRCSTDSPKGVTRVIKLERRILPIATNDFIAGTTAKLRHASN